MNDKGKVLWLVDICGPVRPQVFVESAVKRGKEDKDNYLVQYVRGVFKHLASIAICLITQEAEHVLIGSQLPRVFSSSFQPAPTCGTCAGF